MRLPVAELRPGDVIHVADLRTDLEIEAIDEDLFGGERRLSLADGRLVISLPLAAEVVVVRRGPD